jgi:hypothetical protein
VLAADFGAAEIKLGANTAKMTCLPEYKYLALLAAGSSAGDFPAGCDEDENKPELSEKVHRPLP